MKTSYDKKQNLMTIILFGLVLLLAGSLTVKMVSSSEKKTNEKIEQVQGQILDVERLIQNGKADELYRSDSDNLHPVTYVETSLTRTNLLDYSFIYVSLGINDEIIPNDHEEDTLGNSVSTLLSAAKIAEVAPYYNQITLSGSNAIATLILMSDFTQQGHLRITIDDIYGQSIDSNGLSDRTGLEEAYIQQIVGIK